MGARHQGLIDSLTRLLGAARAATLTEGLDKAPPDELPGRLHGLVTAAEQAFWSCDTQASLAAAFQAVFAAVEAALSSIGLARHHIHLVIPVADRPLHLATCLDSLCRLIGTFSYAGKLTLLVADDSAGQDNLVEQQRLTAQAASPQLETLYFGPAEQWAMYQRLPPALRARLGNLLGEPDPRRMGHKGASVTRNLAYLKLRELAATRARALFFFVDSDQSFHADTRHAEPLYAVNYFYHLDRLFRDRPIDVLTGKVVGDPPVSPAVMAGTQLEDVLAFIDEALARSADEPCPYHRTQPAVSGARYHDMAELFGFEGRADACRYVCPRPPPQDEPHQVADTLVQFARGLERFFHGEHATRRTDFEPTPVDASLAPARTVYTGNYVLSATALAYCIPFAAQRLRMAGPTLGRLLQATLGPRFVSANLPLMHHRTHAAGNAEYRPGVAQRREGIDLSGEYLRQFLGDLMLFSMEQLVRSGYPERLAADVLEQTIAAQAEALLARYANTRSILLQRLAGLEQRLREQADWFRSDVRLRQAAEAFAAFAAQIRANYGEKAVSVRRIGDSAFLAEQRAWLKQALLAYPDDVRQWRAALEAIDSSAAPAKP